MRHQPRLRTERLCLRPFALTDAPVVRELAGQREIASTTLNVPHPYEAGMAEEWISTHQTSFERGELVNFAVTLREGGTLVGAIGLVITQRYNRAEMGYWIGKPYWGRGYCSEAAMALVKYGFGELELNRIFAHHFTRNPASGRVMQKIGMRHEGHLRQHVRKWDVYEDEELYGILRADFDGEVSRLA
jgi:ribosomal-protein-alanine N-acetyltransferase